MPALDAASLLKLIAQNKEKKEKLVKENREKSADLRALQFNEEGRQNDERLAVDKVQGRIEAFEDIVKDGLMSQQEADELKRPLVVEKTRLLAEHKLKKKEFEVQAEPLAEEVNKARADLRLVDGRIEQYEEMLAAIDMSPRTVAPVEPSA